MSQNLCHPILVAAIIFTVNLAALSGAAAQTRQQAAPTPQLSAQTRTVVPTINDARETREQLEELLKRYPVGRVLKLDPSLLLNDAYLASFPPLADFIKEHPEIAHNPAFYFDNVWVTEEQRPASASMRMFNELMQRLFLLIVFTGIGGVLVWLIKTALEQRRWNRLSRIQAEVHGRLLERFASNEEVKAYMQTPAGQRFLEAGPSPVQEEPRALAAPISRILWSLQAGVVLMMGGLGMLLVSRRVAMEPGEFFMAMGILAVALGGGFVISSGVAYLLSRKLGLFESITANHA